MLKRIAVLISIVCCVSIAYAQTGQGTIKGKMIDKSTGEPLPFANVAVMNGGNIVGGAQTDFDGKYTITAVPPGKYNVQATYVGYQPIMMQGVVVTSDKITFLDIKASQGVDLKEFEFVEYDVPLISKDQTSSGGTVTREDLAKMPGRSATAIAQTVGGVYSKDDGSTDMNIRGSRAGGTDVYIDGVRVRGTQNLPNSAIEQVSVITGGLPAEYGDATGGVVSITTRGASREWFGGVEYLTSGGKFGDKVYGLDQFGFNLLGWSISGPLLMKKDSTGEKTDALLGFFLSGEAKSEVDPRPSAIPALKVNDELMTELNENPLSARGGLIGGTVNNAEFLRSSDLEEQGWRQNVGRKSLNLAGKIDIGTSPTTNLTFGGSFDYLDQFSYVRSYALLNSQNNPQTIQNTWRVYGRFTQRFGNSSGDEESASSIKNAFISFQVDYSSYYREIQDDSHGSQLSHYGYVGKFFTNQQISYDFNVSTVTNENGDTLTGYMHNGWAPISYTFERDEINPVLANYTSNYYDLYNDPIGNYQTLIDVQNGGAVVNGANPIAVYDMWTPMGVQYNNYRLDNNKQFRVTASGSADIKDNAIKVGFQYEQRNDRFYDIAPVGLWTVGRNLVNAHIDQLDYNNYTSSYWSNGYDRYTFERLYNGESQSHFSAKMREALGLPVDGTQWIDFDSYGPDIWNVSYFAADEILLNLGRTGTPGVVYAGYDHTGKKISGNPSLDDFFTKTDDDGNLTREIPAFQPIYIAGYIQDKFSFDDLVFNVGLRVDRYDANQPVLKDPFSLFPVKSAGEVGGEHPSNIGDDFVVYVADVADPSTDNIIGYRDGNTWYNADGQEVNDPSILSSSGNPAPWLVEPDKTGVYENLSAESFKDYEPQINVMPRVAFSFPISDEALFFAHYDVLTQRPSAGSRLELLDYLLMESTNYTINNPNLKPEKTIDYELGFQQKVNNYSSLKLAAFYREQRDMVQVRQMIGAYPQNYLTYDNLDFGTVKGLTVAYDLRRKGNVSMRASYTLQFADGTGSSSTTSSNLVSSGQGNLRTLMPLDFDQRHAFVVSMDYRYGKGKDYNGPVWFGKDFFQQTGANLIVRAGSGTPYTKQANIVNKVLFTAGNTQNEGSLNGSRLPWTTTVDLKVDRNIDVKWGKGEDEDKKEATLNVYVQVLNLLNFKNILNVYNTTGNPDDDGYLAEAQFQNFIASQTSEESYRDLYNAKLANPSFYSLPRRIRLGVQLNF